MVTCLLGFPFAPQDQSESMLPAAHPDLARFFHTFQLGAGQAQRLTRSRVIALVAPGRRSSLPASRSSDCSPSTVFRIVSIRRFRSCKVKFKRARQLRHLDAGSGHRVTSVKIEAAVEILCRTCVISRNSANFNLPHLAASGRITTRAYLVRSPNHQHFELVSTSSKVSLVSKSGSTIKSGWKL
jgi:hypothetical protein